VKTLKEIKKKNLKSYDSVYGCGYGIDGTESDNQHQWYIKQKLKLNKNIKKKYLYLLCLGHYAMSPEWHSILV
jgi:hypothetical protein